MYYINIKKHYSKLAIFFPIVAIYINSAKDEIFKKLFDSINQTYTTYVDFYTFLIVSFIIIVISLYIASSLLYSLVYCTYILYRYIRFDKKQNKTLLLDKIHELYKGQQVKFMNLEVSDKLLLLYLYDLKIFN
ncbi:MAG: hypothetical protein WC556_06860 [Candidatus Methanoperedens sp.]